MIFVDTGAWYASLVPTDSDHARAVQWLAENDSPLLTTDYVIDETLTLLRVRGEKRRALLLGSRFFSHALAEIHKITDADLTLAWRTFEQFDDKNRDLLKETPFVLNQQFPFGSATPPDHVSQFANSAWHGVIRDAYQRFG